MSGLHSVFYANTFHEYRPASQRVCLPSAWAFPLWYSLPLLCQALFWPVRFGSHCSPLPVYCWEFEASWGFHRKQHSSPPFNIHITMATSKLWMPPLPFNSLVCLGPASSSTLLPSHPSHSSGSQLLVWHPRSRTVGPLEPFLLALGFWLFSILFSFSGCVTTGKTRQKALSLPGGRVVSDSCASVFLLPV